jgi:hypothetical protein
VAPTDPHLLQYLSHLLDAEEALRRHRRVEPHGEGCLGGQADVLLHADAGDLAGGVAEAFQKVPVWGMVVNVKSVWSGNEL